MIYEHLEKDFYYLTGFLFLLTVGLWFYTYIDKFVIEFCSSVISTFKENKYLHQDILCCSSLLLGCISRA